MPWSRREPSTLVADPGATQYIWPATAGRSRPWSSSTKRLPGPGSEPPRRASRCSGSGATSVSWAARPGARLRPHVRLRLHPRLAGRARRGAAEGLTELASPGARLFCSPSRREGAWCSRVGWIRTNVLALLGTGWELQRAESVVTEDMPPPVRRAEPTLYRLVRRTRLPSDPPACKAVAAPRQRRNQT